MKINDGIRISEKNIRSFLLIGQSNMAGRGDFGEVPRIENANCYMLRMGRWQPMSEPINPDRAILEGEFHSGICLAASFADELAKYSREKIGLIPCADGGTKIEQWMPGEVLFDHAVMMAKLAMRTSTLAGILWHQGESNCSSEENVRAHKEKFVKMITNIRRELGAEDTPLIIGELSENIAERWGIGDRPKAMNRNYREIANELPNTAIVSASGLALKEDGIHFNSTSLREFGKRYFEVYKTLTADKQIHKNTTDKIR